MRTFTVTALIFSLSFAVCVNKAQAGFEFMAPKTQSGQMPLASPVPVVPSIVPAPYRSMAAPMQPVVQEPLSPAMPMAASPQIPVNVPAARQRSLVINPYPLNTGNKGYNINNVSSGSVNRALIEESSMVTPMNLGAGMRTGVQVEHSRVTQKPQNKMAHITSGSPRSLVPIPGTSPMAIEQQRLPVNSYQDAVGFGKDIPLSIALSQIVPEKFNAKLSNEALADSVVSWEGGKPWNQVLNDILRPLGYMASIQGNHVMITQNLRG